MTPDEVLEQLMEGNARYVESHAEHPHQTVSDRMALVKGQNPIAAMIGCADSRVPLELLFDQGFGDLFVARVAGNIADNMVIASMEYAIAMLKVSLLMVVGHSTCGAVDAAIKGGDYPGYLPELVARIQPAVQVGHSHDGDLLENVVKINTQRTVGHLQANSQVIRTAVEEGRLKLVPAYYNLDSGKVDLLG